MKKIVIFCLLSFVSFGFSQNVELLNPTQRLEATDDLLYRIKSFEDAVYLGELKVNPTTGDDFKLFSDVYHQAKSIGANAYIVEDEQINGKSSANDEPFILKLFYLSPEKFKEKRNMLFLFGSSKKDIKIRINDKKGIINAKSYYVIPLQAGQEYKIATRQLLGTSMRFVTSENDKNKYYKITTINFLPQNGNLSFKSSDIISIERSFADFLTVIYQKEFFTN